MSLRHRLAPLLLLIGVAATGCGAGQTHLGSYKAAWHHAVVSPDGRTVTVSFRTDDCTPSSRAVAAETSTTIEITVISSADEDCMTGRATAARATVHLAAPVDGRRLVDGVCDPRYGLNNVSCAKATSTPSG